MNLKINNRLQKISDFIYKEDKVIDIGCDHGLLGIHLVLNKNINKMVSSDINEKPLNKAKENIKKYNLENKIETRLGNGLECVDENIDTIIISGMGGLTINEILNRVNDFPNIKKIVISPNSDFVKTRKHITKLGFYMWKETIVLEKGKYYLISCYLKVKNKKINYYFGKLDFSKEEVVNYYNSIINKNNNIRNNLDYRHIIKKTFLKFENYLIKKMLKKKTQCKN